MAKNRRNRINMADFPAAKPGAQPQSTQPQAGPQQRQPDQWEIGAQNVLNILRADDIKLNHRTREAAEGGVGIMAQTIQQQQQMIAGLQRRIEELESDDEGDDPQED